MSKVMKKINWKKKAEKYYWHGHCTDAIITRLACALKAEARYKKFMRLLDKEICPVDIFDTELLRKIGMFPCPPEKDDVCPRCEKGKDGICDHTKCWRDLMTGLDKE